MTKVSNEHQAKLLSQIFDASLDAVLVLTADHEIQFLNRAARDLLGGGSESLVGAIFPFSIDRGNLTRIEISGPENSTRLVELNTVDLPWDGGKAMLVILRDITTRRAVELALEREKDRLCQTLDMVADAVIVAGADDAVELMNAEAVRLTGVARNDALGKPLGTVLQLRHPGSGKPVKHPAEVLTGEVRAEITPELGIALTRADGAEFYVTAEMRCIFSDEGRNDGCVLVLRDVSLQKEIEDERFQAEKLNSISLLAGGIAHDFNNILTAVLGNLSVVRHEMEVTDDDASARKLLAAEKAALQAKTLTRQLLTFSKGGLPVLEATSLDQLVEDSAQFILRGSNVKCEVLKDPDLWEVDADKGQIAQVVNNLVINADQAMPQGGVVTLSLTNESIRGPQIPSLAPGDYVCVSVKDQGEGIPPENLKRIFDPYFTTKATGNGLGLASSYAIIKSHRGVMTVHSAPGEGSIFRVFLPKTAGTVKRRRDSVEEDSTVHSGEGRILVMDDMEAMMTVAGEIIKVLGYDVAFARDGREAIEAYQQAKEAGCPFNAVVFDLTVPGGMGGEEACALLREYDPDLVAIASSGYTTSAVMTEYEEAGFQAVVPKPYRIKEMSQALHRVLQ